MRTRTARTAARPRRAMALAALLAILFTVQPGAAQTTKDKLDRAKDRLAEIEQDLAAAQSRLEILRAEIEGLNNNILQAIGQRDALEAQIEATNATIERKGRRVGKLQGRLNARARSAYIQGPTALLEFVLEANTLTDLTDRVTFLTALNQADADAAAGLEVEREELDRFHADLEGYLAEQDRLLALLGRQKKQLDAAFAEQAQVAARIEDAYAEAEEAVADLKKQLRRELLAQLRAATAGNAPPIDASGILKWCPVDAPRSYIDDFGFPRSGGRSHQGNDIFAPEGTPIRAPFAGRAEESYNTLGGYSVHVYGADGTYVYNAHLSRYAGIDGQQVKPGDLIGYVGNTGNAVGTPPHNHFELHPGGGSAITPYPFLNAVCGTNGGG
jgi:peptidoglycan LD-endopeptidase LytH